MNRLRRRARSGFSKGKQSSIVKYLKEISGYPLSVSNFLSLVELTISGNCRQSNLPVGYTEVEYIEGTGTQYINTGICPTNNTKVEVVFSADKNSVFVYGSRTQGNANANHSFCIEGAVNGYFQFGNFLASSSQAVSFNSKHTVTISQDGGYFNGELKQSYDTMSFESTVSMYLCGLNYSGSVDSRMFDGKIYSFRVWESGELIQSLVPCKRDSDGAVGMYDTVTGAFLGNGGTGVFVAGAAVTPTPDTPVDIQLCGDRTGNLYDVNDKYRTWQGAESDDAGWIIVNVDNSEGTSDKWPFFTTTYRDVIEPNTQYTVVTEIEYISGGKISPSSTGSVDHMSPFNISFTYSTPGTYCRTVTSKSDLSDCTVLLRSIGFVEAGDTLTAKFRISLLKGTYTAETIPAYEPYGYKVSGRVEGLNLFDYGVFDNTPEYISNNSAIGCFEIQVPNGTYTLSSNIPLKNAYAGLFFIADDLPSVFVTSDHGVSLGTPRTIEVTAGKLYICLYWRDVRPVYEHVFTKDDFTGGTYWIMLLKGSYTADTIPPYEPYQPPQDFAVYLPQQIAKVGDVADTVVVDFEKRTAELVQRTKEIVFDGTENWNTTVNVSNIREFKLYIDSIFRSNAVYCFSNRYKVAYDTKDHCTYMAGNNPVLLHIADNSFTTAAEFKAWLSELYASGEPLKYLFELATPVTTDITAMQDWDAMPELWEGSVIITLESDIEPSNLNLKYYSSVE